MQLLQILLFFLCNYTSVKLEYHYDVYEEVRYITGDFEDIKIITNLENVDMTINDNIIDLNNYYSLDSLIIIGNFKYLYFYGNDNVYSAYLRGSTKNIYNIDDFELLNNLWYERKFNYILNDNKIRKLKYISILNEELKCTNII